jgi:3-dehydroquinate synthase
MRPMDKLCTRVEVGGEAPYPVLIGHDLLTELPALLPGATRVAVLYAAPLTALATTVGEALCESGVTVVPVELPDAEAAKSVSVAALCWERLGAAGFTRTDAVVGVGGGAVTDLTGFVAACWLRGVRWIPVATSLLGMVDAAVGGKTGLNTGAGKNLVGAFHPPTAVLCDLSALATMPAVELLAGLGEVVKYGFIADPAILDLVEADPSGAVDPSSPVLRELVERSVRVKADVVSADLREAGRREILNYGHTLGHAVEQVEGYTWRHGHAVSVGMVYAAALSHAVGRLDQATVRRHRSILELLGLPVRYVSAAGSAGRDLGEPWPRLLAAMRVDKKSRGARLRFVVLDSLASVSILSDPTDELLESVYREVSSS